MSRLPKAKKRQPWKEQGRGHAGQRGQAVQQLKLEVRWEVLSAEVVRRPDSQP